MIAQIILAVGAALGLLIYVAPNLGTISAGILDSIMAPFTLAISQFFSLLGHWSPFMVAVIPLYILVTNRRESDDQATTLFSGAAYGLALYAIAYATGTTNLVVQEMRSSFFTGSVLGTLITGLGSVAGAIIGLVGAVVLWGAGILLSILGAFLDAVVGIGQAAERGRAPVNNARAGILGRLLGRGN
jgi:hypothetical protein